MFQILKKFGSWNPSQQTAFARLTISNKLWLEAPQHKHFQSWKEARGTDKDFFQAWEPKWAENELSFTAFKQRVEQSYSQQKDGDGATYLLMFGKDNVIGGISLFNIRKGSSKSGTIGYWLSQHHNGKGYMSDALGTLCQHAFTNLNLERIEASCLPNNTRSLNLLKRGNFREEGLCRSYLEINGKREDHLLFARIK